MCPSLVTFFMYFYALRLTDDALSDHMEPMVTGMARLTMARMSEADMENEYGIIQ